MNPTSPKLGQPVIHRGADGQFRAAIVTHVWGPMCLNLFVFGKDGGDAVAGTHTSVTHADPKEEPGCKPSWDYTEDDKALHAMQDQVSTLEVGELSDPAVSSRINAAHGLMHSLTDESPLKKAAEAYLLKQLAI